jgi:hypothetical protein
VDGKDITPNELAEKYFSSPEDCFNDDISPNMASISNVLYTQIIQRKITPPASNNILSEFHNNRIEEKTTAIAAYKLP